MVLDDEEHRGVILQLLEKASFPGEFAEKVVALKKSVREATVGYAVAEPARD